MVPWGFFDINIGCSKKKKKIASVMKRLVLGVFHNSTSQGDGPEGRATARQMNELRFIYAPLFKVEKPGALLNAV